MTTLHKLKKKHVIYLMALCIVMIIVALFPSHLPVTGNIIAASRIIKYAHQVYPDSITDQTQYATYNPVSANYNISFTNQAGTNFTLTCDPDGPIFDEERAAEYYKQHNLDSLLNQLDSSSNARGYLSCFWWEDEPENVQIGLIVRLGESESIPFPETEAALQLKLADCLLFYYDSLKASIPTVCKQLAYLRLDYQHSSTDKAQSKDYDNITYQINIPYSQDEVLLKESILNSTLSKLPD